MPTVAELAQQELDRRYSLQGRTQLSPRVQTMQNARPTVRSALSNLMRDAVDATGLEGGYRQGLLNAAGGVETAADFLPVVGDVLGLEDASRAYGQGDMVGAGINMLGAVPIVGDVAAKGVRSALRGLDMNPEARMQRAQDLGFDTDNVFYHGTSSDFTEMQPSTVGDLGGGVYVTPNPEKASGYAAVRKFMKRQTNNAGPNVLPLRVKSNLNYLDLQGSSIMPFDETRIQSLKDQGYEGIRQFDTEGNIIQMNIFDPKNIRSTSAEFDPSKADSADLLSSVGATSALRGIV